MLLSPVINFSPVSLKIRDKVQLPVSKDLSPVVTLVINIHLRISANFCNNLNCFLIWYSGAWGTLIHETNLAKISCQTPFKAEADLPENLSNSSRCSIIDYYIRCIYLWDTLYTVCNKIYHLKYTDQVKYHLFSKGVVFTILDLNGIFFMVADIDSRSWTDGPSMIVGRRLYTLTTVGNVLGKW